MSKRFYLLMVVLLGNVTNLFSQGSPAPPCPICPPDEQIPVDGLPLYIALALASVLGYFLVSKLKTKSVK
jgi:hypothetical protein